MNRKLLCRFAACAFATIVVHPLPSAAQSSEIKEKPPLYTYIAEWQIPRAHWSEVGKSNDADKPVLDKAMADGTIVAYGSDSAVVHKANQTTHDNWWASTSIAGLMKVLDLFITSGSNAPDATATATVHEDEVMMSRYYNWKSGAYKGGYTEIAQYKLTPNAPGDTIDSLSKNLVAPLLEKLLADGTLVEYEIDEQAVHTDDPSYFWISVTTAKAEGVDKVNTAVVDTLKTSPLSGVAFDNLTDLAQHRDMLIRGDGVYK